MVAQHNGRTKAGPCLPSPIREFCPPDLVIAWSSCPYASPKVLITSLDRLALIK